MFHCYDSAQTCVINAVEYNRKTWQDFKDSFEENESFSSCAGELDKEFQCLSEQDCGILSDIFRGSSRSAFGECAKNHAKLDACM